jgi:hypothetical protein
MQLAVVLIGLGALAQPAAAFQETTVGAGNQQPQATAPVTEPPKSAVDAGKGKGLSLTMPEVSLGKGSGTEVRIPGIGTVGVLPKLDFGLELLYGANEPKSGPDDKADQGDLQIRGTVKHRF